MHFNIMPSLLSGNLTIPPSKSHTIRAILFAALAKGTSYIENFLQSPDSQAMITAVRLLGAQVDVYSNSLKICGCAGKITSFQDVIQCGNSGQVLRFIGALSGLLSHYTVLTGDVSIRQQRLMKPLIDGLSQLGAFAVSSLDNGYAPLIIKGPLRGSVAYVDGEDSQPISGLLMAAAFAPHPIELHVSNPGEKPWIDLTLHWFEKLGIIYQRQDYSYYRLEGNSQIEAFNYQVPGDFSTAAFPIAAALITGSRLTLHGLDMQDPQGDKAFIPLLEKMGASFEIDHKNMTVTTLAGACLQGIQADINDFVDALPILAVVGCFAQGRTEITNASIARKKESDRIHLIVKELKKMGARIEEREDGFIVEKSELQGANLEAHQDHRLGLALMVAALAAKSSSQILGVDCIAKTYPCFDEEFRSIGAIIKR